MTNVSGVTALLAGAAGLCMTVAAQEGRGPVRIADGHWIGHEPGSCGKAEAARRRWAAEQFDEDPFGTCLAREAAGDTDLLHCNLDIEVVPSNPMISGSNTFSVMSKVDGLTQFTFRLRNNYTISSALVNGATAVTVASPSTTTRVATLDRAYDAGEVFTLKISYAGVPVSRGFGSIEFTSQNGHPLVASLSEPYFAYTWWPCKDGDFGLAGDNSDKFTVEVAITAPQALTSISNGLLQGVDTVAGGKRRHRWASNIPIATYLVCFATTTYNQWTKTYGYPLPGGGNGTMPVEFSIYPANDNAANRSAWEKCIPMLATFRPLFGEYPFVSEKYGIYNFSFGGGMEHQTSTGQGGFGESLTAHELAHQWWGDDVTCRTWSDIWLNEGFATYAEALWEQYKPGSTGWPAYRAAMNARRPASVGDSVYVYNPDDVGRIFSSNYSYRKGAWVVHMLRKVLGDQAFFDMLAAYRAAYSGSGATTDDLAAVVSAVAGRDMGWFFQQWVYGIGAPAYAFGHQSVSINGQHYLKLSVRQTQPSAYGIFTMPIDVRIDTAPESSTVTIWNDAITEHYLIPIAGAATGVALDADEWILTTAKSAGSYLTGPPKIIDAAPAPWTAALPALAPSQVTVTFSEGVAASAADFTLAGPSGAVPFSFAYAGLTATLTLPAPLPSGAYTLTVRDTLRSAAASIQLDGEVPALPAGAFPTGDGQPGGDAVIEFQVLPADCYPNCDGSVAGPVLNVADFTCFLQRFASGDMYANCDASTEPPALNVADFTCFLQRFAAGCR